MMNEADDYTNFEIKLRAAYVETPNYLRVLDGINWIQARMRYLDARQALAQNEQSNEHDHIDASPTEGRMLVVSGITGMGKNSALTRALNCTKLSSKGGPVLQVTMPGSCTIAALGAAVLRALNYPYERKHISADDVWRVAQVQLAAAGVRLLWIDEVDDIYRVANSTEILKIAIRFRALLEDRLHPICLILSGLPQIKDLFGSFETREQRRRMRLIELSALPEAEASALFSELLNSYCRVVGIRCAVTDADDFAARLWHIHDGALGAMVETVIDTILDVVRMKEDTLTLASFARLHHMRTSVGELENPFVQIHWREIDLSRLGNRDAEVLKVSLSKRKGKR